MRHDIQEKYTYTTGGVERRNAQERNAPSSNTYRYILSPHDSPHEPHYSTLPASEALLKCCPSPRGGGGGSVGVPPPLLVAPLPWRRLFSLGGRDRPGGIWAFTNGASLLLFSPAQTFFALRAKRGFQNPPMAPRPWRPLPLRSGGRARYWLSRRLRSV